MFSRTIWCLIACVLVESIKPVSLTEKSILDNQKDFHTFENKKLAVNSFGFKSGETKSEKVNITKRGIVLVDEDFDVPSTIYVHENRSGLNLNARADMFDRNEGSGNEDFEGNKLDKATSDARPQLESSSISTELPKGMKSTEMKDILLLTNSSISTELTKEMKSTEEIKDILLLTDSQSSGDDIFITKEYSTTELTTEIHTDSVHEFPVVLSEICLNTTCSQDDLFVTGTKESSVPEGINITLLCKSNSSNDHTLYWYKNNGTVYFLQTLGTEEELQFNIPDAKSFHTGIYLCVKVVANTQTCCNLKSYLSVYEVPLYRYHLVILTLIVVAGLILCIFLTVQQTITLKAYTKQFVKRHGKVKQLL